ncbi:Tryptophan--tRNA ligase [Desulfovibrionales bacterium]
MNEYKFRIVSGMRPTGPLHLGHYFGVLKNWIAHQETHDCFYFVADWHALTTEYANPWNIKNFIPELVKDWISAGLDPERCTIFQQSSVPTHAELHLILSMFTLIGWLERNPTYKDVKQELAVKGLNTYGFLGYPVLQAADILAYRPQAVSVGQDQLPHLELTREIARRFNYLYGNFFPEPEAYLTLVTKCPGLDGRKMSKSYGNAIQLRESMDEIKPKVMAMFTDTNRLRKSDPGDPNICNVFIYHLLMTGEDDIAYIRDGCTHATWGCVDCKKKLLEGLAVFLEPIHARRKALEINPDHFWHILRTGNARALAESTATLIAIRNLMNFNF